MAREMASPLDDDDLEVNDATAISRLLLVAVAGSGCGSYQRAKKKEERIWFGEKI